MVLSSKKAFHSILKLIIQIWLLGFFLHFFGMPALERFHDKKVIVVTSTKATGGTPAPAVTIAVRNKETGIGWKKSQIRGFVNNLCADANTTETIIDCIASQTYNLSEIVAKVESGIGNYAQVVKDPWKEDFSYRYAGRTYTLDISKKMRVQSVWSNPLRIVLKQNLLYDLYVHDPKFFYISRNADAGHSGVHKLVDPKELPYYYPFALTEVEELNVPDDPCNEDPDFNYRKCIRESFTKKVGCSTKWDHTTQRGMHLCSNLHQFG